MSNKNKYNTKIILYLLITLAALTLSVYLNLLPKENKQENVYQRPENNDSVHVDARGIKHGMEGHDHSTMAETN